MFLGLDPCGSPILSYSSSAAVLVGLSFLGMGLLLVRMGVGFTWDGPGLMWVHVRSPTWIPHG
eukprot:scaffold56_cov390-Pavlova_lutheri.AAC.8